MSSIADVQDDGKVKSCRKKRPAILDYLDDLDPPAPLHKKVSAMDKKRAQSFYATSPINENNGEIPEKEKIQGGIREKKKYQSGIREKKKYQSGIREKKNFQSGIQEKKKFQSGIVGADDLPVFVPNHELLADINVEAQHLRVKCRHIISRYDELKLGLMFETIEENCRFRLYLYAVAHGMGRSWNQDPVHMRVLKRVLDLISEEKRIYIPQDEQGRNTQKNDVTQENRVLENRVLENRVLENRVPENSILQENSVSQEKNNISTKIISQKNGIVITKEKINVPHRILKHLSAT